MQHSFTFGETFFLELYLTNDNPVYHHCKNQYLNNITKS